MKGACITVHVQPDAQPGPHDVSVGIQISPFIYRRVMTPLDHPGKSLSALQSMPCTFPVEIRMVMDERKSVARMLSEHLTNALMEAFGKFDTIQGYAKEEPRP